MFIFDGEVVTGIEKKVIKEKNSKDRARVIGEIVNTIIIDHKLLKPAPNQDPLGFKEPEFQKLFVNFTTSIGLEEEKDASEKYRIDNRNKFRDQINIMLDKFYKELNNLLNKKTFAKDDLKI